jgi:tRNA modification GTPase
MSFEPTTIYAPATPVMPSGLIVLRVSGPRTAEIIRALSRQETLPIPRMATLQRLYTLEEPAECIDEALILWFPAPHSFTGEDVGEFHLHGSLAVIKLMLAALSIFPKTRLAEPGEFAKRAFLHGKMDLVQAEGLADLIAAETRMQHRQAMRQKSGAMGAVFDSWRAQLLEMLALVEAYIDFPDEDIPEEVVEEMRQMRGILHQQLSKHLDDKRAGERLREGLQLAIIGAPNVGKSSLLNRLIGRELAIVSAQAGTTRDTIEAQLDIGGYPFTLVDTAGLRASDDAIEQEGIARARLRAEQADVVLVVYDASHYPSRDIQSLPGQVVIEVANKIDLLPDTVLEQWPDALPVSATDDIGLDALRAKMVAAASTMLSPAEEGLITRARHRALLTEACDALAAAATHDDTVIMAEHLRHAAHALGQITGKIDIDEILDQVFSKFCIGK